MNAKPFSFEQFKSLYSTVPRLCVDLIVQSEEGILLSLRKIQPNKGMWHLPGGTVLFKEGIEDAVHKVALDELGIDVKIEKFLGYIEFLEQNKFGGFDHPISLAFLCRPQEGQLSTNEQSEQLKYFAEMPDNLMQEQKKFIEKML